MSTCTGKQIWSLFISVSLILSFLSGSFAVDSRVSLENSSGQKSWVSKVADKAKKIVSSSKFYIPAAILSVLSLPSIYSNIKCSKPRRITKKIIGETDEKIGRYRTYDCLGYRENPNFISQLQPKINEIIQEMNEHGHTNDYDKALFIHDYIYKHCEYDIGSFIDYFVHLNLGAENTYNAFGCLLENRAVCSGISAAYVLLLRAVGVECKALDGKAFGSNHSWNIVKINGMWYHVDVTWDLFVKPIHGKYAWFMCTEREILKDHIPDFVN